MYSYISRCSLVTQSASRLSENDGVEIKDGYSIHYGNGYFAVCLGTQQRPKYPRHTLCCVLHTAKDTRQIGVGKQDLCCVTFIGHTAKSLPSVKKNTRHKCFQKTDFKNRKQKKFNAWRTPPVSHRHQSRKSQLFLCTLRLVGFEPATSPSHLTFSTTTPHTQLCLYFIFFPHILY